MTRPDRQVRSVTVPPVGSQALLSDPGPCGAVSGVRSSWAVIGDKADVRMALSLFTDFENLTVMVPALSGAPARSAGWLAVAAALTAHFSRHTKHDLATGNATVADDRFGDAGRRWGRTVSWHPPIRCGSV